MSFKLVLFIALLSFSAFADLSRIGIEIRGIKTKDTSNLLLGARYLHNISPNFGVGGATYTGQVSEGAAGAFSYGGLIAAYNGNVSDFFALEVSALLGGGGGFIENQAWGGGMTLEPSFSAIFKLGKAARATIGVGYVWLPNNQRFSGITTGLRFDFLGSSE